MSPNEQPPIGQSPINPLEPSGAPQPPVTPPGPAIPPPSSPPPVPPVVPGPSPSGQLASPIVPPPSPSPVPVAAGGTGAPWQGAFGALQQGIQGIMANPVPGIIFVAASAVLGFIFLALHIPTSTAPGQSAAAVSAEWGEVVISLILLRAMAVYELSIADKKPLSVSQFLSINVKQFLSIIVASIVVGVLALLSVFTLFIALIWIIPWFITLALVVVDQDLGPFAALGRNRALARHHKGKAWAVVGVILIVSIVASIVGRIPYIDFIVTPAAGVVTASVLAIFYRWLRQNAGSAAAPVPPVAPPPPAAPIVA